MSQVRDQASGPLGGADEDTPEWLARARDEPAPVDSDIPSSPSPKGGRRPFARAAAVCAALVLAVYGASRLVTSEAPAPAEEGRPPTSAGAGPVRGTAGEPVAAVARALQRSVVQIETGGGLGSGVIYDEDGFILTAAHVVAGQSEVTVRLADGERLEGDVVGADDTTDVAVVRVARRGLPAASLAIGLPLRVGQLAVAMGSPFGLEGSVTAGVVSAVGRSVPTQDGSAATMIQTDAPINPGNSGGALADQRGRVIGINVSIRSSSGVNSGVGFAVPIDTAASVADALVRGQVPRLGYLGVSGSEPTSGPAGALVTEVQPGSPAETGGLREGDLITALDGAPLEGMTELASQIRQLEPGTPVVFDVLREGSRLRMEIRIGAQ